MLLTESTAVFADGSYYHEIGVGAWAFRIPVFDLLIADASRGPSNTHFELLGALFGLEAAAARGARTLTLFTDCTYVADALTSVLRGEKPVRIPPSDEDLICRLMSLVDEVQIGVTLVKKPHPDHLACDRAAFTKVQSLISADPLLTLRLSFAKESARLSGYIGELAKAQQSLQKSQERVWSQEGIVRALDMALHPETDIDEKAFRTVYSCPAFAGSGRDDREPTCTSLAE
jgi:ribonuclease HI